MVPTMLVRVDLKSYTCDAFFAVLLLLLLTRLETKWTRRRLGALAAVGVVGMLFSHTVVLVAGCIVAALAVVLFVRHRRQRLKELAVAASVMFLGQAVIYVLLDRPHKTPATTGYWYLYYLPVDQGLDGAYNFVADKIGAITPSLGIGSFLIVAVFATAGIVTLLRRGHPALALAIPMFVVAELAASAMHFYPFLDPRTSTFLAVAVVLLMAIGIAGATAWLARRQPIVAGGLALVIVGLWIFANTASVRTHPLPFADMRSPASYIEAHRRPGDTVVVSFSASWEFAYYARSAHATFVSTTVTPIGYRPVSRESQWMVFPRDRTPKEVVAALHLARTRAGRHGRVWVALSHLVGPEETKWRREIARLHMKTIGSWGFASELFRLDPSELRTAAPHAST